MKRRLLSLAGSLSLALVPGVTALWMFSYWWRLDIACFTPRGRACDAAPGRAVSFLTISTARPGAALCAAVEMLHEAKDLEQSETAASKEMRGAPDVGQTLQ